jgi:REP element-mobilizing transposase RayT
MSNHYHLMVETPEANLLAGMRWLQNTYTRRADCGFTKVRTQVEASKPTPQVALKDQ